MKNICRDCLEEVDKLTKTGICKKCYSRKANAKARNKKYIPLKDLPEGERQRVSSLRGNTNALRNKPGEDKDEAEEHYQNFVNQVAQGSNTLYEEILRLLNIDEKQIREEIDKDIEKEFERRKINLKYSDYVPLDEAFETLWCICNQDNYLTEYPLAEQALTDFVNDFQHQNENSSLKDLRNFIITAIRENQSLVRRRPIKDVVNQLACTQELRDYIQKDTKLMELINNTRINLKNEVQKQANPIYVSKASELILNVGNVLPEKRRIKQRYDVFVPCYNLFGNPNQQVFHMKGGTIAETPEEAKQKLRDLLATYFKSVTYKDIDIQAVPMDMVQKEEA